MPTLVRPIPGASGYDGGMSVSDAVERFLGSGRFDPRFREWEGAAAERRAQGEATLRDILVRVVRWRAERAPIKVVPVPADAEARVRARVAPLVHGLFEADRAEQLLDRLPARVVLLTPRTFAANIGAIPLARAWDLANVLLDDLGAPPLADDVPELDGLCSEGRAYLLPRALVSDAPFPDILTHEVAHLLHTVSAADLGLEGSGGPLLPLQPRHHETFAYACEVWAGAVRGGTDGIAERVGAWRESSEAVDARVERRELDPLLDAAVADPARGWAVIRAWVRAG